MASEYISLFVVEIPLFGTELTNKLYNALLLR